MIHHKSIRVGLQAHCNILKFRHGKSSSPWFWWEENLSVQDRRDQTHSKQLGSWHPRHTLRACCTDQTQQVQGLEKKTGELSVTESSQGDAVVQTVSQEVALSRLQEHCKLWKSCTFIFQRQEYTGCQMTRVFFL